MLVHAASYMLVHAASYVLVHAICCKVYGVYTYLGLARTICMYSVFVVLLYMLPMRVNAALEVARPTKA